MTALVYLLLCLIWGSTWLMIKIGLNDSPPLTAAALRFVVAVSILFAVARIRGAVFPDSWTAILRRAYPGLYMYGIGYPLVYIAEEHISSSLTAVLFASFPMFVALLASFMFREERTTGRMWIGLLLGLSGIVVISIDSLNLSGNLFLGTMLALAGSFSSAFGLMAHKKRFRQDDIFVSVSLQMGIGGLPLIAAALIFERFSEFEPTLPALSSIIYLALFGSVIAFIGYYWLIARVSAVVVSFIAFITPIVAVLIGVGLGGESLTPPTVYGSLLILVGVFLVIKR